MDCIFCGGWFATSNKDDKICYGCERAMYKLKIGWMNPERLKKIIEAENDGRLVVLDEPRKPLIWGDKNHETIICPKCKHDLMGGFLEDDIGEVHMYQCPYCGQPICEGKAIEFKEG